MVKPRLSLCISWRYRESIGKTTLVISTARGSKLLASFFGCIIAREEGCWCQLQREEYGNQNLSGHVKEKNFCHRGEWNQNPSVAKLLAYRLSYTGHKVNTTSGIHFGRSGKSSLLNTVQMLVREANLRLKLNRRTYHPDIK